MEYLSKSETEKTTRLRYGHTVAAKLWLGHEMNHFNEPLFSLGLSFWAGRVKQEQLTSGAPPVLTVSKSKFVPQ